MRRVVEADLRRLGFDLPLAVWCAAPSEPVIATRGLSRDDDVIAHQMAGHAMRAEHPEYGGGAGGVRLRVAPRLGSSGFGARLHSAALCCRTAIGCPPATGPDLRGNGLSWACAAAGRRMKAASAADEPITALLDLAVDDVGESWITREAADQIGEHACDGDSSDRHDVGARR